MGTAPMDPRSTTTDLTTPSHPVYPFYSASCPWGISKRYPNRLSGVSPPMGNPAKRAMTPVSLVRIKEIFYDSSSFISLI
ncbi:hypothetical protein TMatcc_003447 [Talaromyces marneffei ATCC 18224]|uniref:uncharacterized protein n=1 Tax=Talaromyces marneffei TaxID=37727 RepID=UPI0012A9429F|nr:uncharacterized protein EYB26_001506 [Talaromyces marneffei]QGA13855.1 hypothetical protein EYB26_001506 [Talaromyces marneffei]